MNPVTGSGPAAQHAVGEPLMDKQTLMKLTALALCSAALLAPAGWAVAQSNVVYVDKVSDLHSQTAANVNVNSYYGGDSNDGGGGTFIHMSADSCTDEDGGATFSAGDSGCYKRQFTGPVHLKWYGVTSTASDNPINDVSAQLNAALTVAALAEPGIITPATRVVDTDAMRIDVNNSIYIPEEVRLTCDATPGAQRLSGTFPSMAKPDYTHTPASIVLTKKSISILMLDDKDAGVHDDNSEFDHCIVLTTGDTSLTTAGNINLNPQDIVDAMQDV